MPQTLIGRIYHKLWSKTWDAAHAVGIDFSPRGVFRHIYRNKTWGDAESVSGPGSELGETRKVREVLPALLRELGVKSMLDAPCGDWNWMKTIDLSGIDYIGAEVVPELVERNTRLYGLGPVPQAAMGSSAGDSIARMRESRAPGAAATGGSRRFIIADITKDPLPRVDLILCRDCLVHLSNKLARAAIDNFRRSGGTWLLTTTYPGALPGDGANRDIATGQFRMVDLTRPPFDMPPPERVINEESAEGGAHKSLGLWRLGSSA